MKVIVPMAGMGKRMRPHTLSVPKPLIQIAGKPIVQRLVEEIAKVSTEKIEEIAFVIGEFGAEVEQDLLKIAERLGAKGSLYHQDEPLGTAHAIYCAAPALEGKTIVAFADTLFKANFHMEEGADGLIWVNQIDDPSAFGVVTLDEMGFISDFVEKPQEFVSDLAIIGIYYFKEGKELKRHIEKLLDEHIVVGGEYQLTDALKNMQKEGIKFRTGKVEEWLDCGNKNATVYTNQRILEHNKNEVLIAETAKVINSVIIEPVFIGEGAVIKNSVIGPHLSVGAKCNITGSILSNSIIQENTVLRNLNLTNSMIGNYVIYTQENREVNVGDFTHIG